MYFWVTMPVAAAVVRGGTHGRVVMVDKVIRSEQEWRRALTPEQFHVTREKGTEAPFTGAYWGHHEQGIYRCACCGAELFHSDHKFDSGTGWPSFWQPAVPEIVRTEDDVSEAPHRSAVQPLRCASRPRIRRWPCPDGTALLHQLRVAPARQEMRDSAPPWDWRFVTRPAARSAFALRSRGAKWTIRNSGPIIVGLSVLAARFLSCS